MPKILTSETPVPPIGEPTADWSRSQVDRVGWASEKLARYEVLYQAEQNPMFAWRAYQVAREAGLTIPTWILEYFDFASDNLFRLGCQLGGKDADASGKIAPGITAALGFVTGGIELTYIRNNYPNAPEASREGSGPFNPFTDVADPPAFRHANAVWIYTKLGRSVPEAKRAVKNVHKVSVRTIERALKQFPLSVFDRLQRAARDTK